jgi:hypothetical protein
MAAGPLVWGVLWIWLGPGRPGAWLERPTLLLWLALALPVLEELAFRGGVQDILARHTARRLGPLTAANLGTSALFAALHLFAHPPLWAAAVLLPSLLFGYFRERCACLAAPIALHAFYNSGYFLLLAVPD